MDVVERWKGSFPPEYIIILFPPPPSLSNILLTPLCMFHKHCFKAAKPRFLWFTLSIQLV